MNQRMHFGGWTRVAALAAATALTACSSGDNGLAAGRATNSSESVVTTPSRPATSADSTDTSAPDTQVTETPTTDTEASDTSAVPASSPDTSTDSSAVGPDSTGPAGGPAQRPEGTWTLILRSEIADPPYDSFTPGHPLLYQWKLEPTCDGGACDIDVEGGENGFLPEGLPQPTNVLAAPFTLELQADGTYTGSSTFDDQPCTSSEGDSLDNGMSLTFEYTFSFKPAHDNEAPTLYGTRTNNAKPTATGLAAGCIEYHDTESIVGQPLDYWSTVDPSSLTFGTYTWGGLVSSADSYFLDNVAAVGDYRTFNSELTLSPTCTDPCTFDASGVVPAFPDQTGTFTAQENRLDSANEWHDTCVKNGTSDVIVQDGFVDQDEIQLKPAIIVGGEVLAMVGTFKKHSTPTDAAAAASSVDCALAFEEYAAFASTTKPYFTGL
ncbi:MAG: hypothetical protein JWN62_3540 [Acidimicrobiales bacterium]|nr:hypothetical protein [Acidimicrobiales bacterium]